MNINSRLVLAWGLCLLVSAAAPHAQRQSNGGKNLPKLKDNVLVSAPAMSLRSKSATEHLLTFSGPFGVPGVSLPAGIYSFKFTAPGVIQVRNADGTVPYTQFVTTEARIATRMAYSDGAITWREQIEGAPPQIENWFLPGRSKGWHFVY
jgi:hypothetical protein